MYNIICITTKNIFSKFYLLFLIIIVAILILDEDSHKKEVNSIEDYFCQAICKFFYFTINYNCSSQFSYYDFYEDIVEINNTNKYKNIKTGKHTFIIRNYSFFKKKFNFIL